jgi:AraC family ethanolamine operon transcriptional activator
MTTGNYVCRQFDDIDEMVQSFSSHWDLEFHQFEPTESSSSLKQLTLTNIQITNAIFSGKSLLRGGTPNWKTFAFHKGRESSFVWRKKQVRHNDLMIFPDTAEIEVAHKGRANNPFSISLSDSLMASSLSASEREKYSRIVTEHEIIPFNIQTLEELASIINYYLRIRAAKPDFLQSQLFQDKLEGAVVKTLLHHIISLGPVNTIKEQKQFIKKWEKIDKALSNDPKSLLTVSELSDITGINQRTMVRLFHRRYGLSPKAYLKVMRLNKVKNALKNASPHHLTVAEIANHYGLFHTGQFAKDYHLLFNELPSKTLIYG